MASDDSKYIQLHAKKLNKKEGHSKAKTIALEKKKIGGCKECGSIQHSSKNHKSTMGNDIDD